MSKTLYDITVRDNMNLREFTRMASNEEEVKRSFKAYDIIKITPRKVIDFKIKLSSGGVIRG